VLLRASALLASAHAPEGVLLRASALLASAHTPEGVLLRASAPTPGCVSLGLIGVAALSRVSPRARGRVAPGFGTHVRVRVARACRHCGSFSRQSARPRACLLRASAHTAECLLLGVVGAAALFHFSPRARGRVAPGLGVHGRVLVTLSCRCCGSFSLQPTRPRACCAGLRRARPSACCSALSVLRLFLASTHAPKCVLLQPTRPRACCSGPRRARPSTCYAALSVLRLFLTSARLSACCSALSVLRLFLTSAHAPEGVLLRASACTAECLLLGLVGAAALSRVSPRAQVRVARACRRCGSFPHRPTRPRAGCSGLRRTRPGACCSALSALRLLLASAHAPEGVFAPGFGTHGRVLVARPCRCCGSFSRQPHAPEGVLLRASACTAECLLLGRVGAAALSRVSPRAQVRVARPCRRCGSFPRQPTRRSACCSGLRPTSPSACCSGLSALTPSLVAWDCRHCAERLFLASDRPPGRGARVCWRCSAFSVRCCRRGCGLA